eukprot:10393896-Alexandrium_andersonii.AAC.1
MGPLLCEEPNVRSTIRSRPVGAATRLNAQPALPKTHEIASSAQTLNCADLGTASKSVPEAPE